MQNLLDTDNSLVITTGKGEWGHVEMVKEDEMVIQGELTWDGEHTIIYTDDVLQNSIPETYMILVTNVTLIIQYF